MAGEDEIKRARRVLRNARALDATPVVCHRCEQLTLCMTPSHRDHRFTCSKCSDH